MSHTEKKFWRFFFFVLKYNNKTCSGIKNEQAQLLLYKTLIFQESREPNNFDFKMDSW